EKDMTWLKQDPLHHIITCKDRAYPVWLREIYAPPPVLFCKGDLGVLQRKQIAVVGSRNPSFSGLHNAGFFTQGLVAAGLTVTSGLALGIDAACHQAALQSLGKTVAVLGSGLDCLYPKTNQGLAARIATQ